MLCDLPSWLTGRATDRNLLQKDKISNLRGLRIDAFKLVLTLVYSGEASSMIDAMSQGVQNQKIQLVMVTRLYVFWLFIIEMKGRERLASTH
jgi:hypothetical protein